MCRKSSWLVAVFVVFTLLTMMSITDSCAEGLTKEQGDAILNELRQIRTLLGRQQLPPAPQIPPPSDKVMLKLGTDYTLGRSDAPVTIVEYTDYQCAFCNRFHTNVYPEIKKNFIDTGKVRFIKRDLALDFHQNALKAAQASRCAGDQEKFWEMHDLLSANPNTLGPEAYAKYARDLGLNAGVFKACVDSEKYITEIRDSGQGASMNGIRGTPSFVIGTVKGDTLDGIKVIGAQPFPVFEKVIKDYLARQAGEKAAN